MPLPPYIRRGEADELDEERYQTVFAREPGAIAAPTAGLHLTEALLESLQQRGVGVAELVLHVGAGTFRPLQEGDLARGTLHPERYRLPEATAQAVGATRAAGGRVVAVGTTSARVLESCVTSEATPPFDGDRPAPLLRPGTREPQSFLRPGTGETRLFLRPGSRFQAIDGLLTNFHLPRSSLLLLVCAFAGRERVLAAYDEAVAKRYRFYSYGDAMLIL
jgi:S-adenosylmethionine:tRNA ribosyltransferase-isomerase